MLRTVHRELKLTSVFVTYDHQEAFCLADLVAILDSSNVEQFAIPLDNLKSPISEILANGRILRQRFAILAVRIQSVLDGTPYELEEGRIKTSSGTGRNNI